MANYNITLDKRTLLGKNLFNFLVGMNCIKEDRPDIAEIDERTSDGRKITQILYDFGIIESPYDKAFVAKVKKSQREIQRGLGTLITNVDEL